MIWTKVSAGYYRSGKYEAIRESDGTGWGLWEGSRRAAFVGTYKQAREKAESYVAAEPAERVGDVPSGLCLRADPPHIPHMQAVSPECRDEQGDDADDRCPLCGGPLASDGVCADDNCGADDDEQPPTAPEYAGCTRADDWAGPHAFEYDPTAVDHSHDEVDAWERCGRRADDDVHAGDPATLDPQPTHYGDDYLLPVCEVDNGLPVLVAFNTDAVTCPVCLAWLARNPDAPQRFAESTALAAVDPLHTPPVAFEFKTSDRGPGDPEIAAQLAVYAGAPSPAAPADLNDDAAWQQYIAALPVPSTAEYAAVLAEFGDPYGDRVAECADHFRRSARAIWRHRAAGTLTPESYERHRGAMRVARECIDTYRRLSTAWARRTAEQYATA